jgi:ATPase family associated with various cellular activities (AAA)
MVDKSAEGRSMRYAPAERLLRLARHLAATRTGLTLDEMATELEVGRRTAERLRDSLMAIFPQMEPWDDDDRVRRWRLPGSALVGVVGREAEIAASVLRAALDQRESGINLLFYGPPGTGKTVFAATLAAHVGARLRPITEADEAGEEPCRQERLAGLRLAQRLVTRGDTVLLFARCAKDSHERGAAAAAPSNWS